jgi:hypothetical protein
MKKLIPIFLTIALSSCYYDKEDQLYPAPQSNTCDTTGLTYTTHIAPILNQNCATSSCHDAATKSFTHDLSSYDGTKEVANKGVLLTSIRHEGAYPMPKNMPKLSDCNIAKITAWVNAGMPQ